MFSINPIPKVKAYVITVQVHDVNVNGVLFTAQAVGRQMIRFGTPGSIILIASISGSITNKVSPSLRNHLIVLISILRILTGPSMDII